MTILDCDTEDYVSNFKDADFTTSDFLKMFVLICSCQNQFEFNIRSLINFIYLCKNNGRFNRILNDIKIKNNGVFVYSNELEEAISRLKFASILYTDSSLCDGVIYIFKDIKLTEFMKFRNDYFDEMNDFVREFNSSLDRQENSKLVLYNS